MGVKIPCVGYGTWRTPDGIDTVKAVREALDCGYRHIDTAQLMEMKKCRKGIRESGLTEASCLSPRSLRIRTRATTVPLGHSREA